MQSPLAVSARLDYTLAHSISCLATTCFLRTLNFGSGVCLAKVPHGGWKVSFLSIHLDCRTSER